MPVPTNNATASSVNGTLVAAALTLGNTDKQARIVLSGTYTGVTGTIDVSMDGTTWINHQAVQEDSGVLVNGTISPSASNLSYLVDCDGWQQVRFNCTACASGTCVQTVYGGAALSSATNPILANTSSQTSFTSGTFSGTLGVSGAVTLSSTLAVASAVTMTTSATVGTTLGVTGASTLTGAVVTGTTISAGGKVFPTTDDGAALGDTTHNFSDLFGATGFVFNIANGNWVMTHTSAIMTVGTGDLRVTTAGTNTASVVTVGGTQTLAAKTFTAPVIGVATGTSLAVSGLLTSSGTAGIGYATGAGGTVTQATDKSTGATLSKTCGAITMNNAALAAATIVSFTLTNTTIAATDVLVLNHISGGTVGSYTLNAACGAGSAVIYVRNNTAGSLSEAIVIQFAVVKGVNA